MYKLNTRVTSNLQILLGSEVVDQLFSAVRRGLSINTLRCSWDLKVWAKSYGDLPTVGVPGYPNIYNIWMCFLVENPQKKLDENWENTHIFLRKPPYQSISSPKQLPHLPCYGYIILCFLRLPIKPDLVMSLRILCFFCGSR